MADESGVQAGGGFAPDDGFTVIDDEADDGSSGNEAAPRAEAGTAESAAIDANRVRQLSALRRGAYRARSYCFVGVGLCAVAAVQLSLLAARHVRAAGWQLRPVGYLCGALAALMAGTFFYRKAAELARELGRKSPALADPQTPPDFSTLSDGSHAWKNLEQMREGS